MKSWQSLSETRTSISLNKLSYEAFMSAAMIITYPNPLSFRLNNEAMIPKEYLSMTKYSFFEVGFTEKRNKLQNGEEMTRLRPESRTATRVVKSPEVIFTLCSRSGPLP